MKNIIYDIMCDICVYMYVCFSWEIILYFSWEYLKTNFSADLNNFD